MKKIILSLTMAMSGYCSYAQTSLFSIRGAGLDVHYINNPPYVEMAALKTKLSQVEKKQTNQAALQQQIDELNKKLSQLLNK